MTHENEIKKLKAEILAVKRKTLEVEIKIEREKELKTLKRNLSQIKNPGLSVLKYGKLTSNQKEAKDNFLNGVKVGILVTFTFLGAFFKELGKANDRFFGSHDEGDYREELPAFLK